MSPEELYAQIEAAKPDASEAEKMDAFWEAALSLADTDLKAAVKLTIGMVRNQTMTADRDYRRLHDLAITAFNS